MKLDNKEKYQYKVLNKAPGVKTSWRGICLIVSVVFIISCIVTSVIFFSMSKGHSGYNEFDTFVKKYRKKYESKQLYADKTKTFEENVKRINQFNAEQHDFKLEVNEFADLTDEEFYQLKSLKPFKGTPQQVTNPLLSKTFRPIEWEGKALRDEGDCGGSWAFSSIFSMESLYAAGNKQFKRLSYQELLDCATTDKANFSCSAGDPCSAFNYVKEYGIASHRDYPRYVDDRKCFNDVTKRVFKLQRGCVTVQPNSSFALAYELEKRPLSVYITSSTFAFRFYKSGIITEGCNGTLGHYATIIGTDKDNEGRMYWKVRNTWGSNWGDNGYVKILREDNEQPIPSICDVTISPSYPA